MKVTNGNILIQVDVPETSSVIELTDNTGEVSDRATVVLSGVDGVKKDDYILWNKYQGKFVQLDGEEYVLITEHDVLIIF